MKGVTFLCRKGTMSVCAWHSHHNTCLDLASIPAWRGSHSKGSEWSPTDKINKENRHYDENATKSRGKRHDVPCLLVQGSVNLRASFFNSSKWRDVVSETCSPEVLRSEPVPPAGGINTLTPSNQSTSARSRTSLNQKASHNPFKSFLCLPLAHPLCLHTKIHSTR